MNGRVIPIIGSSPIVIEILYICWNSSTAIIPPIAYLSGNSFVLFTEFISVRSKNNIMIIKPNEPIRPVFDANTAKIKSVCISGKYIGVLFIPCPVKPEDPMAINEFLSCSPSDEDQLVILSIR